MIWTGRYPIGFLSSILSYSLIICISIWELRVRLSMERIHSELPGESPPTTNREASLAG